LKAVVTGGAGFIGSHITDELLKRGVDTIVMDDFSTGSMANLSEHRNNKLLRVVQGDVAQAKRFLGDVGEVDVVFHEAAIANVLKSVQDPALVHNVNVNATLGLMDFCVAKHVRKLVFASSAAVYGIVDVPPASEDMVCAPHSPYGASKLAVEGYLNAYYKSYGLETVALRYFNVYGPRQKSDHYSGVITAFTKSLLLRESPMIYGDGMQTRDFVNVRDIVQANMLAMESENAGGSIFNVASGDSISVLELFEKLRTVTGARNVEPRFAPPRAGDVREGSASIAKIRKSVGYSPSVSPEEGLAEVAQYIKQANIGVALAR
jgi:nucleoside-diphosphate-sugar epimerase